MATIDGFNVTEYMRESRAEPLPSTLPVEDVTIIEPPTIFNSFDSQAALRIVEGLTQQAAAGMVSGDYRQSSGYGGQGSNGKDGKKKEQQQQAAADAVMLSNYNAMVEDFESKTGGLSAAEWLLLSRTEKEANIRENQADELEIREKELIADGEDPKLASQRAIDEAIEAADMAAKAIENQKDLTNGTTQNAVTQATAQGYRTSGDYNSENASESMKQMMERYNGDISDTIEQLNDLIVKNVESGEILVKAAEELEKQIENLKNSPMKDQPQIREQIANMEQQLIEIDDNLADSTNLNMYASELKIFLEDYGDQLENMPPTEIMTLISEETQIIESFSNLVSEDELEGLFHQAAETLGINPEYAAQYMKALQELKQAEEQIEEHDKNIEELSASAQYQDPALGGNMNAIMGTISPLASEQDIIQYELEQKESAEDTRDQAQEEIEAIEKSILGDTSDGEICMKPDEMQAILDSNAVTINDLLSQGAVPESVLRETLKDLGIPEGPTMDSALETVIERNPDANITPRMDTPVYTQNDIVPKSFAGNGPSSLNDAFKAAADPSSKQETTPEVKNTPKPEQTAEYDAALNAGIG